MVVLVADAVLRDVESSRDCLVALAAAAGEERQDWRSISLGAADRTSADEDAKQLMMAEL